MYLIFTRQCYFMCFFTVFFVIYCMPRFSANPIASPNSFYDQFINILNNKHCEMPSEIVLPFGPTPGKMNKWEFLSHPLQICQTPKAENKKELSSILCSELFDVLRNITCDLDHSVPLPKIQVPISSDVCPDFTKKKDLLSNKTKYLGKRLADPLVCIVACGNETESACKFLLWSYEVESQIYANNNEENELHDIDPTGKNEKKDLLNAKNEDVPYNSSPFKKTSMLDKNLSNKNTEDKTPLSKASGENKDHSDQSITLTSEPTLNQNVETSNQLEELEEKKLKQIKNTAIIDETYNGTNQIISETSTTENGEQNLNLPENIESEKDTVVKNQNDVEKSDITFVGNDLHNNVDDSVTPKQLNQEMSTKAFPKTDGEMTGNEISPVADVIPKETIEAITKNIISSMSDINPKETNKGKTENHTSSMIGGIPKGTTDDKTEKDTFSVPGKTTGQEVEEIISQVPVTIPKKTSEIPKEEESDVPIPSVIEDNQKSNVASSTVAVQLEKMEEGDEVRPPLDKDQEQYPDLESTEGDFEGEYPRSEFEGSMDQISGSKDSSSKVPEPPKSSGAQLDDDTNKIHFDSDDVQSIPMNQGTFPQQEGGHFFFYFLSIILIVMAGYLIFHNKQKIIALIVEGRHEKRRRAHGVGYKKLETK